MKKPARPRRAAPTGDAVRIYGWHAALAALQNPRRDVRSVHVTDKAAERLAALIPEIEPTVVTMDDLARMVGREAVHQGVVASFSPLAPVEIEDVAEAGRLLVLDEVTDPQNVGAILRSAAAFGAGGVLVTARNAPPETSVLAKAASGALEHVPLVRVANLARALVELREFGFRVIGLDGAADASIVAFADEAKLALVLGAEGRGLRRLTAERCDALARIPTAPAFPSLNVSNAAAVALYAVTRASDNDA